MGDEHVGQRHIPLQILHQIEHLCAHGNIQRGNRLIADDKFRIEDQGARNHDSLALAAGKFMRIAVEIFMRQADLGHHLQNGLFALGLRADFKHIQRRADQLLDRHSRIERRIRVLEDNLHLASIIAHFLRAQRAQVNAGENHLARVRLMQAQNGSAQRRFAAAGFADHAKRFAAPNFKADVIHRANGFRFAFQKFLLRREVLFQMLDAKQRLLCAHSSTSGYVSLYFQHLTFWPVGV